MSITVIDAGGCAAPISCPAENTPRHVKKDVADTVGKLREKLERYHNRRAKRAGWTRRFIPTGLAPLDAVLPHGGVPCGAITEILADGPGIGVMSLAMRIARQCMEYEENGQAGARSFRRLPDHGQTSVTVPSVDTWNHRAAGAPPAVILLDANRDFYPPAALQHGLVLDRLIVLRTGRTEEALWAVDQSLRCPAVAAVIAPITQLDERHSRRLQLAAESSGNVGLILRPAGQRVKSFATVRMLVEGGPHEMSTDAGYSMWSPERRPAGDSYLCRITLLTVREGRPVEPFWVDLHHETGTGSLHSLPVDRSAAKTG